MDFLFAIVLIIFFGRSLGMLMKRLGIQPLVGEVLAGIILGPVALSVTNGSWGIESSEPLKVFSDFGIILLMLLSGLMTDFRSLSENSKASIIIGGLGVVASFVLILLPVNLLCEIWFSFYYPTLSGPPGNFFSNTIENMALRERSVLYKKYTDRAAKVHRYFSL